MQTFAIEGFFETSIEDPVTGEEVSLSFGPSVLQIVTSGADASFTYLPEENPFGGLPFFVPWTLEGRVGAVLLNDTPLPENVELGFGRISLEGGLDFDVLTFFSPEGAPDGADIEHVFFLSPPGAPLPGSSAEFAALRSQVVGLGEVTSGPFVPATEIVFADHFALAPTPGGIAALAGLNTATDVASMDAALRVALEGTSALAFYEAQSPQVQAQVAADMLLNRPGTTAISFEGTQVFSEGILPFATPNGTPMLGVAPVILPLFGPGSENQLIGIPEPEASVFVDLDDFGLMALFGAAGPVFEFDGQVSIRAEVLEMTIDEAVLRDLIGDAYDPLADAGTFDGLVPGAYQLFQVLVSGAVAQQDPITGEFAGMSGPELVVNVLTQEGVGLESLLVELPSDAIVLANYEQLDDDETVGAAWFAIDRLTLGNTDWDMGFDSVAQAGGLLNGLTGFRAALELVLEQVADGAVTVDALRALEAATSVLPTGGYPSGELIPPVVLERAGAFFAAPEAAQEAALGDISASGAASFGELLRALGDAAEGMETEPETISLEGSVTGRDGAGLGGTTVTFIPDSGEALSTVTGGDGAFALEDIASGTAGQLQASRDFTTGDPGPSISSAINAIRLALGLGLPGQAEVTAQDWIAADFTGDGRVGLDDGIEILRAALGLGTEHAARWVFLDAAADLSAVSQTNVVYDTGIDLAALDADTGGLALTGILVGHVQEFTLPG